MIHAWYADGSIFPDPISKVVCVGRNYAAHAKELNNPVPESPLLFIKPNSAVVPFAGRIVIPKAVGEVHFETELAVLVGATLCKAGMEQVSGSLAGLGIGLDLTLRDVQAKLKKQGHPWEKSKAFDSACPLSAFVSFNGQALDEIEFELAINGGLHQSGRTGNMLVPVVPLLADISQFFTLHPGDVVLTGTPEGVGPLKAGDNLRIRGVGGICERCVVA